jgi:hypothetical protein
VSFRIAQHIALARMFNFLRITHEARGFCVIPYCTSHSTHMQGWPEPHVYTAYDLTFGGFPAKNSLHIYMVLANPTHMYVYFPTLTTT